MEKGKKDIIKLGLLLLPKDGQRLHCVQSSVCNEDISSRSKVVEVSTLAAPPQENSASLMPTAPPQACAGAAAGQGRDSEEKQC